ncbi:MAG: hypothetical protein IPQ02_08415 [Saprospiraceae bacterium]|nr:hypothetical protein [Candidatus Defluviibacterium haderslevense]
MKNKKIKFIPSASIYALILLLIVVCSTGLFAQSGNSFVGSNVFTGGVGLGTVIAVILSWSRNQSILWAIFHGILNWIYVIYFAITREKN